MNTQDASRFSYLRKVRKKDAKNAENFSLRFNFTREQAEYLSRAEVDTKVLRIAAMLDKAGIPYKWFDDE